VVNKRVGDIVQGDKTGDKPLSEVVKEYIKEKYNKVKFSLAWYIV
jgi:23S rRNA pseudouridine1911/1915/1917 synthase